MSDSVGVIDLLVLAVVEARDRDGHGRDPVGNRETLFGGLSCEFADADHDVGGRNFESEIVKRLFAEAVQVRIPGFTRTHVVTSRPRVAQNFVTDVIDGDGMLLPDGRRLVENGVERAIFFWIFLNEMQVLAILDRVTRE